MTREVVCQSSLFRSILLGRKLFRDIAIDVLLLISLLIVTDLSNFIYANYIWKTAGDNTFKH